MKKSYLIRIELNHADEEKAIIYRELRALLFDKHIYNALRHPNSLPTSPIWHELPRSTYFTDYYQQTSADEILKLVDKTIDEALTALKAKEALVAPPIKSSVVVAEASGQHPFATNFPITKAPVRLG